MPRLLLNPDIVSRNISRISKKSIDHNLEFRPHFKTHQSQEIGRWFKDKDVQGITVSSLEMAVYFAQDGWQDITVAFPVNVLEHKLIHALASNISLNLLIVSIESLRLLQKNLEMPIGLYIEVDPGYGRSGVSSEKITDIQELINMINDHPNTLFKGFYTHAGHTYAARGSEGVKTIAEASMRRLSGLGHHFPNIPICFGDTPSCSVLDEFGPVTQLSAGNLVFYDWIQTKIGSCTPKDIAVMMECPVVEKYDDRNQLLIHGGAVHFSKDHLIENDIKIFGVVTEDWGKPMEENYISSLSQEHGIVQCTRSYFESINIGDTVNIFPIHSCLTANLMGAYHIEGKAELVDHFSKQHYSR